MYLSQMISSAFIKKHYLFLSLNIVSIILLNIWIFKSCMDVNSSITSIIMDFFALLTCIFSVIRVSQSIRGDFKIMDMVTIYYASCFFLFSWFIKMLYLVWDHFWVKDHNDFNLIVSIVVFITLLVNFYTTEKVNMSNLDKIESDL